MGLSVGNSPHPDIPMLVALDGKYIDLRVIILDRNLTVCQHHRDPIFHLSLIHI